MLYMNKLLLCLTLIFLSFLSPAQKVINDPNVQVRTVGGFHAIHISSAFDVILTQGTEAQVAVSANDEKLLPYIITTVTNGVLIVKTENNKALWRGNHKLRAYIAVKDLDELKVGGATTVKIDNNLNANSLKLDLSGSSRFNGVLTVNEKLSIDLSGASDLNISGKASETSITASGASDVKAYDFKTEVCSVQASGASDIQISVDKELSANLSGASSIRYKGEATVKNLKTSGASNVSKKS